jgi:hypothetical protein
VVGFEGWVAVGALAAPVVGAFAAAAAVPADVSADEADGSSAWAVNVPAAVAIAAKWTKARVRTRA